MAYASKELKEKVINLIKDYADKNGIEVGLSAKISNYTRLSINIKSCSIDLSGNLFETLQNKIAQIKVDVDNGIYAEFSDLAKYEKLLNENNQKREEWEIQGLRFTEYDYKLCFSGQALDFVTHLFESIKCEYSDDSDHYRGYLDYAYYYDLHIGNNAGGFKVKEPKTKKLKAAA